MLHSLTVSTITSLERETSSGMHLMLRTIGALHSVDVFENVSVEEVELKTEVDVKPPSSLVVV